MARDGCEACAFEVGRESPKDGGEYFACALWAHTCGVTLCPICNGYGVVDGEMMGMFAVIGGKPCPHCTKGRVYPGSGVPALGYVKWPKDVALNWFEYESGARNYCTMWIGPCVCGKTHTEITFTPRGAMTFKGACQGRDKE